MVYGDDLIFPHKCCNMLMTFVEVFGVRIYTCQHRAHHPVIYLNLNTGDETIDELLEVKYQDG